MTDIVKRLRSPVNKKEDHFISQWPGEEPKINDAVRFEAADEIEQNRIDLEEYRRDVERLRAALRLAVMSDTEYCAELERINKALLEAPTVDIDVVVPERDYSQMTPKDCYEAGLLDGVFQAREAIKGAARAALETPTEAAKPRISTASAAENTDD